MDMTVSPSPTQLAQGAVLRLRDVQGQGVAVFDGMVWVTQNGDPRDVFVGNGEYFQFDRKGVTLIQAVQPTKFVVLEAGGG